MEEVSEGKFSVAEVQEILKNVDQMFYQDIVEERSGNDCCGYLLCDKECIEKMRCYSKYDSYSVSHTLCFIKSVKMFMQKSLHQTKSKCFEFHVIIIRFLTLKKEKSFVPMFVFAVPCLFSVRFLIFRNLAFTRDL